MTTMNWERNRQLGAIGEALSDQAARNLGYTVSEIGFEYQVEEPVLRHLHLIGADLAGPDRLYSHPGGALVVDVKTSGLCQPLAWQTTWLFETRHLVALETYEANHKIPAKFSFVDPFRELVYLCSPLHTRYAMEQFGQLWRIRARDLPQYWYWFRGVDQAA